MPNPKFAFDAKTAELMTSYIETYHPKMTKWLEPVNEPIEMVELTQVTDSQGTTATYRRATNFSGNLESAIKVIEFNRF